MSQNFCVDGASISITPNDGSSFGTTSDTIAGGSQTKMLVGALELLIDADLDSWIGGFTTSYTVGTYTTPGTLTGGSISGVSGQATKFLINSTADVHIVTTTATATHIVVTPALDPNSNPDPSPTHSSDIAYTSANQSKFSGS